MPRDGGCGQALKTGTGGELRVEFGNAWLTRMKNFPRGEGEYTLLSIFNL